MISWDKRTPVSVEQIGKFTITIYDQGLYDESLRLYPDDPDQPARPVRTDNDKPMFARKKKPASRWNWIVRPEQPLGNLAQEKGSIA